MFEYSKLTDDEKIEKFLQAIQVAFSGMGEGEFWPANAPQIEASFSDILAVSIFEKFKGDKEKFKKALDRVEPEVLKALLYLGGGIIGLKVARIYEDYEISIEELKDFVVCILDSVAKRRKGDEFCLGGKNLVLSSEEVKRLIKKTKWPAAKELELKKAIAGLNVTAESLTWAIFYDIYRYAGMLIHGPYQVSRGILLCREFPDLNPPIWNLQNRCPKLKVHLIYEEGVEIKIDFLNHQIYEVPIVDSLRFYSIATDKPLKTLKEIGELDNYYSRLRQEQAERVGGLKPLEIIKKGAKIHYYMLKDFFEFYGEDWWPPKEVYERIGRMGLKYWKRYRRPRHPHQEKGLWARKVFDPRNNFI